MFPVVDDFVGCHTTYNSLLISQTLSLHDLKTNFHYKIAKKLPIGSLSFTYNQILIHKVLLYESCDNI